MVASEGGGARKRPRIGLALGGGVARGWAHIGALRALRRYGIEPDVIAGSSVGALVGGLYLAGKLSALETWARSLTRLRIAGYLDLRLSSGGLIGGTHLVTELRRHIGDTTIESLRAPFVAVATDLATGHEVWLREGPLAESMRASFSLPGVFPPVNMDGKWLVDGALVNPVPVSVCRALGCQLVIAVNLSADLIGKARKPGAQIATAAGFDLISLLEQPAPSYVPAPSALNALTRRIFRRDYEGPSMFGVMVSAFSIITDRITRSRLAGEPPDVHITPRLGHIGLLEFDRAEEVIVEGEAAVERALPELCDAVSVFSNGAISPVGNGRGK
ncbi:MAG: patatin-like phospholipase family protein [Rhodospirillaceae bacterium]